MNNTLAIKNPECTCFNCLEETKIYTIPIPRMEYGSIFDGWATTIQLCDKCLSLTNPEWWKLETINIDDEYSRSKYKYENQIIEYVDQMPIAGQELFWNYYSSGSWNMEAQDWIDYELGILSDNKYKEYGLSIE